MDIVAVMTTNIVIEDQLTAEAMKASGYTAKREVVDRGLKARKADSIAPG